MAKVSLDDGMIAMTVVKRILTIQHISKLTSFRTKSFSIFGISWTFQVFRQNNALGIYLQCMGNMNTPEWEVAAWFKIRLMSFTRDNSFDYYIAPFVFNSSSFGDSFGLPAFITWDELTDDKEGFVEKDNDMIKLKMEIMVQNPMDPDRSVLECEKCEIDEKSDNEARFRLTVKNVEDLMAVRSQPFEFRGFQWEFVVYREHADTLGMVLQAKDTFVLCKVKVVVKLQTTNREVELDPTSCEHEFLEPESIDIANIIPWYILMQEANGYVNDDSIILDVNFMTNYDTIKEEPIMIDD